MTQAGEARIGEAATPLGWDHNHLLPSADLTIPEAMARIVEQIPDVVAIDTGDEQLTYADVVRRANQVANALLDREPDPAVPVALLCGHGDAPVVAITGTLHAGLLGAPIDAREPPDRLERFIRASGAQHVVAAREHLDIAGAFFAPERILVLEETERSGSMLPAVEIPERHPGLVLFTSGSTGMPKGVVRRHSDLVPLAVRTGAQEGTAVGDRDALTTSFGFSSAQNRIWHAFVNGATLCTYDLGTRGPRGLPDWVRRKEIDAITVIPSTLRALADLTSPGTMDCVTHALFGGETLFYRDVRIARTLFGPATILRNRLSSTESGLIAHYDVPADEDGREGPVPVGIVDPDVEVRIVGDDDEPVSEGEVGRVVVVRHDRVALGYWNDPELTRRHFFTEPDGRRGFRTPDACRWRDDGLLEHVGRIDSRVKVHGAMVATSEVEVALISLPDVADAAVVPVADEDGTRLVAYVVAHDGAPLSAWKLRRDLSGVLSSTAVPNAFVALGTLPRTVRDKIDRASLPAPPPPIRRRPYRQPMGIHDDLAQIFAAVLGEERVGLDDDFFELGGDSLGVIELLAIVNERFGLDLQTSDVLDAPTVAQLSRYLSRRRRPRRASPLVELRSGLPKPAFFCVTAAGAPAVSLRALSQAMPDQNFVAIQPPGLEDRSRPDRSVHGAARRAVLAIRKQQPNGPYRLGCYSFGARIAFEMACVLEATGEHVSLLVVLDAASPGRGSDLVGNAGSRWASIQTDAVPDPAQRRPVVATRWAAQWAYAHARYRAALCTAGLLPRRGLNQFDLRVAHAQLARRYHPARMYHGPMLLVRGDVADCDSASSDGNARAQWDFGWSDYATGPIEVVDVPSEHMDLLRAPAVERVAQHIERALDKASSLSDGD